MWNWPFGKAAKERRAMKRAKEAAVALRMAPSLIDPRFEGGNISYMDRKPGEVPAIFVSGERYGKQGCKDERVRDEVRGMIKNELSRPRLSSPPAGRLGRCPASVSDDMLDVANPLSPLNPTSPLSPFNPIDAMTVDSKPSSSCAPDTSSSSSYSSSDSGSSSSSDSGSSGGCD